MLDYLTLIFLCQLIGEWISKAIQLPLPGPVIGMVLLFGILLYKGHVPDTLAKVSDALLSNLSLLFVPAGVGVMAHATLLSNDWLPLSVGIIISTLITIAVTATTMLGIRRLQAKFHSRKLDS